MRTDCVGEKNLHLKKNDWTVIQFNQYEDYGRVIRCRGEIPYGTEQASLPRILRRATLHDQSKANENHIRSKTIQRKASGIITKHDIGIHVNEIHVSFDRKKLSVKFTAEGRVDFRELIRELSSTLNMKVELRQIGPRDVAKTNGGLGTCGRVLCCTSWIHEYESINVKMAKDQGVNLNPNNITGQCGRLKCCLKFEHEGYKMLAEDMPLAGSRVVIKGGEGRVVDLNLLKESISVRLKENGKIIHILRKDWQARNKETGEVTSSCEDCTSDTGPCGMDDDESYNYEYFN